MVGVEKIKIVEKRGRRRVGNGRNKKERKYRR